MQQNGYSRHGGDDEIVIKGDSQLVIHQMNGTWQVKSETSKTFVPEIRRLLEGRKTRLCLDTKRTECGG